MRTKTTNPLLTAAEVRGALRGDTRSLELFDLTEQAEGRYAQSNADPDKAGVIKAHFDFAEHILLLPLFETTIAEKDKYAVAYRSFKRVVELDPKHAGARGRIQTIVNIYLSWGKPLPGSD